MPLFKNATLENLCKTPLFERDIVSGRVALLPRSTEIQPFVAKIRKKKKKLYSSSLENWLFYL
ncbi:hypothetical protein AALP_AAs60744U000100 [Arabis alpina]|uniref:Uncharacterized protein n=1 Tax=Arabis alpina TaxID=50452 RepID=A0A087G0J2_ARAAL|nr:hypothetical protein AALP_AAs60744U000100 [Arabis alpina]